MTPDPEMGMAAFGVSSVNCRSAHLDGGALVVARAVWVAPALAVAVGLDVAGVLVATGVVPGDVASVGEIVAGALVNGLPAPQPTATTKQTELTAKRRIQTLTFFLTSYLSSGVRRRSSLSGSARAHSASPETKTGASQRCWPAGSS